MHKGKNYAVVCSSTYEVSLDGPYPDYVEFANDFNVAVRQKVKFEWMPVSVALSNVTA